MATETYRGRVFDTSTGREWTKADTERARRWREENERYMRRCPLCGEWTIDTRSGANECGFCECPHGVPTNTCGVCL